MLTFRSPLSTLHDVEVFAADSSSAQLLVRSSTDDVTAVIGDRRATAPTSAGVAAITISGLDPATSYPVELVDATGNPRGRTDVTTRASIGSISARIATISDIHLGLEEFGVGRKLVDDHAEPYALRCARAAIDEAVAWGAELLLIKGDLTEAGAESDWALAGDLLDGLDIPVLFTPGNHDVWNTRELEPAEGAQSIGLDFAPVQTVDLSGVRVVLADTSRAGRGTGDLARMTDELVDAVACDQPVLLAFHHNIQRVPIPWFWPPGISSPNAQRAVRAIESVNPRLFLTSGHTHRNRVHRLGRDRQIPYTEVSSTSDYPGVWAGYEVSDRTIRQTVWRIGRPDVVDWTERTRRVLGGVWPRWSQGLLDDRCVDLEL